MGSKQAKVWPEDADRLIKVAHLARVYETLRRRPDPRPPPRLAAPKRPPIGFCPSPFLTPSGSRKRASALPIDTPGDTPGGIGGYQCRFYAHLHMHVLENHEDRIGTRQR